MGAGADLADGGHGRGGAEDADHGEKDGEEVLVGGWGWG